MSPSKICELVISIYILNLLCVENYLLFSLHSYMFVVYLTPSYQLTLQDCISGNINCVKFLCCHSFLEFCHLPQTIQSTAQPFTTASTDLFFHR